MLLAASSPLSWFKLFATQLITRTYLSYLISSCFPAVIAFQVNRSLSLSHGYHSMVCRLMKLLLLRQLESRNPTRLQVVSIVNISDYQRWCCSCFEACKMFVLWNSLASPSLNELQWRELLPFLKWCFPNLVLPQLPFAGRIFFLTSTSPVLLSKLSQILIHHSHSWYILSSHL